MATTRIISMHVSHGKTIADCLTDRIDYSKNPDKTQGGELISAYECDPKTADAEFLYSKRQYQTITGREQRHDVIAYQVRQSFKPGEITPEEANRVGYEFAERFLKGRHAFFVATHTDKKHIHNHIIWNSTTLDCKHKFRDFLGSGRAVARLSDAICTEHRLSVIADPKRGKNHYGKWLGDNAKPTHIIVHTLLLSFKGNIHHLSTRKKRRKVTDILAYVEKSFNLKKTVSVSKCFARLSDICAKYPDIY